MSFPTIPAILSAFLLAGSAGVATTASSNDDAMAMRDDHRDDHEARHAERDVAKAARKADSDDRREANLQRVFEAKDPDRAVRAKQRLEALGKIDGMPTPQPRAALAEGHGKAKAKGQAKREAEVRGEDRAKDKSKSNTKDKSKANGKAKDKDKDKGRR